MSKLIKDLLSKAFFPNAPASLPFGDMLNGVFFRPRADNYDFPMHGPNAIRFVEALVEGEPTAEPGLIRAADEQQRKEARNMYINSYADIMAAVGVNLGESTAAKDKKKIAELLKIAALYHDIGKFIRRANHPPIGSNLVRNFEEGERRRLVDALVYEGESAAEAESAKHNRFSLIASIIQHHDKFGVACSGEAGLPIFSDILYFTSNERHRGGIKKNITAVMLMNLADIAAVCTADKKTKDQSILIANAISDFRAGKQLEGIFKGKDESALLDDLIALCKQPSSCLGIGARKISQVLSDWEVLIQAVDDESVLGNRVRMKSRLLELERNPARTIQRVLRLLEESLATTGCERLLEYATPSSVESVLVGTLGAHQFQSFCEQFATVVKLDYGLSFFQAITCACARKRLYEKYSLDLNRRNGLQWKRLTQEEAGRLLSLGTNPQLILTELVGELATLFAQVIEGLLARYEGVLDYRSLSPHRFGFQMRDLTEDDRIRDTIIDLLCIQEHKDPMALTWIVDEVTIWSMD